MKLTLFGKLHRLYKLWKLHYGGYIDNLVKFWVNYIEYTDYTNYGEYIGVQTLKLTIFGKLHRLYKLWKIHWDGHMDNLVKYFN